MNVLNARMYGVTPEVAALWRRLLECIATQAGLAVEWLEYPAPAPLERLWDRHDLAAAFMCGLPFSRSSAPPQLIAAPVPSPTDYADQPCYWSEMVVAADSTFRTLQETFGQRIAFTDAGSQSGYAAPLAMFEDLAPGSNRLPGPLYQAIIGPVVTPIGALQAVVAGSAEVAPVDSYAFNLLQRYRPELTAQVRSIARTRATPIPVLTASRHALPHEQLQELRQALSNAHRHEPSAALMRALLLGRFCLPDANSYAALAERFERARRYWALNPLAARVPPEFKPTGSLSA